jgi:DNA modification methylase
MSSGKNPATWRTGIKPPGGALAIRDRVKELRRVRAGELAPNAKNWRRHPKAQADALRGLLAEVGYADALLARELPDGRLVLIDGHLRAATTPDAIVPVLVLDVTEEEADKLLATLDPLAAMAEADAAALGQLLESVRSDNEAVSELLGRLADQHPYEPVAAEDVDEAEVAPERAEQLRAKWQTQLGQLWVIGPHRLMCGDSAEPAEIERLWKGSDRRLRLIWTDPPYGVSYGDKTAWSKRHGGGRARRAIANDWLGPNELQKLFAGALAIARAYALPGAALYATVPSLFLKHFIAGLEQGGFSYRHCLVWVKQALVMGRSDYHYRHEPILYGWLENGAHYFIDDRTQDSVFEVDRPLSSPEHPTSKPVALVARMLANSSRAGELVYDPFCGGGATLVAAHQLGRVAYGCELDPAYAAVALERLALLRLSPTLEALL